MVFEKSKKIDELADWFGADHDFAREIVLDALGLGLGFDCALSGLKLVLSVVTLKSYPLFASDVSRIVGCPVESAEDVLTEALKKGKIDFLPGYRQLLKKYVLPSLKMFCEKLEKE